MYEGCFTSVDRLERCYAIDEGAFCTAGPSGMSVTLVAGVGISYDGVTGSDLGGNSMEMGTSFQTPAGTVECDSSTRGITCVDLTMSGNYFVIGDHYVRIANDGRETRYED